MEKMENRLKIKCINERKYSFSLLDYICIICEIAMKIATPCLQLITMVNVPLKLI